jgi:hypothetical protein
MFIKKIKVLSDGSLYFHKILNLKQAKKSVFQKLDFKNCMLYKKHMTKSFDSKYSLQYKKKYLN